MNLPDYQHSSLVNLMSRLAREFGANDQAYAAFEHEALAPLTDYQHIVLLIIDGMGARYLARQTGYLHAHQCAELTSVFPTTTASAITTFMTGLAPQQHGLTGWFTYLKELGAVTAVLPFSCAAVAKLSLSVVSISLPYTAMYRFLICCR